MYAQRCTSVERRIIKFTNCENLYFNAIINFLPWYGLQNASLFALGLVIVDGGLLCHLLEHSLLLFLGFLIIISIVFIGTSLHEHLNHFLGGISSNCLFGAYAVLNWLATAFKRCCIARYP